MFRSKKDKQQPASSRNHTPPRNDTYFTPSNYSAPANTGMSVSSSRVNSGRPGMGLPPIPKTTWADIQKADPKLYRAIYKSFAINARLKAAANAAREKHSRQ